MEASLTHDTCQELSVSELVHNRNKKGTEKEIYNKQNIFWIVDGKKDDANRLDIKTIELHKLVKNRNIDKTIIFNNTNKNGTEKEIKLNWKARAFHN